MIFAWFAGWLASDVWKYEKVQQSRVPARFCCSEVRKSATVSCSRSVLLFGSTKKCNSLVFPLAFAIWKYEKCNSLVFPLAFGSLGSISQKGLPGVPPTTAKQCSVLDRLQYRNALFLRPVRTKILVGSLADSTRS